MISRSQRLVEAASRQELRLHMAERRVRDAVFDLRNEAEHLAPDGALLARLDALEGLIARCRADVLRAEVEGARLRGLIAQAALHGQ